MLSFGSTRQSVCHHCRYRRVLETFAQARQRRFRPIVPTRRYLSDVQYKAPRFENDDWDQYEDNAPNTAASYRDRTGGTGVKRLTLNLNKLALEMNTLGRPASILRFDVDGHKKARLRWERETNDQISEQLKQKEEEEAQQDPSTDITQALQEGTKELSEAETTAAIEEMKDAWLMAMDPNAIPTAANCWELFERLEEAFSVRQLKKYLIDTARIDAFDYDDLEGRFESPVCTRTSWVSHNSGLADEPPGLVPFAKKKNHGLALKLGAHPWLLKSYAEEKGKIQKRVWKKGTKVWLVEHVLRKSWHMRTAEELETQGCVDISDLAPDHCRLLRRFDLFRHIEQQLGVHVTFNSKATAETTGIRLIGRHEPCARAFIAIYAPLSNIKTRTLSIASNHAGRRIWEHSNRLALLAKIGDVAKVHIEFVKKGLDFDFKVVYVAPANADGAGLDESAYEKAADSIRAVLADSTMEEPLVSIDSGSEARQLVPLELSSILPIHLHGMEWNRNVVMASTDRATSLQHPANDRDTVQDILEVSAKVLTFSTFDQSRTTDLSNAYWQADAVCRVNLETGYVAFLAPKHQQGKNPQGRYLSRIPGFRTFAPIVPGGISALERLDAASPRSESRVALTLKAQTGTTFPDLEIQIEPSPSGRGFTLEAVQFSLGHSVHQMMLPAEVSDVRIRCRTVVAASSELDPNIQNWLGKIVSVDGHVDERTVLRSLELDVPVQATSEWWQEPEENATDAPVDAKATYRLARLEYQDRILSMYRGCELAYHVVDAGDMKGRYEQLVMEMPDEDSSAKAHEGFASDEAVQDTKRRSGGHEALIKAGLASSRLEVDNTKVEGVYRLADWLGKGVEMIKRLA